MNFITAILGGLLICFGVLVLIINFVSQITNYINYKKGLQKYSSPAPFIGPLAIIVGYWILPLRFYPLIFLVFVFDPDTLSTLWSLPNLIKELRKERKNK